MDTYAVIDIGTNSARLMIAQAGQGRVESRYKTLRTIRVGEGMQSGQIAESAITRAQGAISEFSAIAAQHSAKKLFCFATSAVREAANKDAFVRAIADCCGVAVDIVSGETEALLGFAGAVPGIGGMIDIGGGSTEVMTGSLNAAAFSRSFRIGTVRLLQMFPSADDADPKVFADAHALAAQTFAGLPEPNGFIYQAIGGTATALAAIDLGLKEYDPARVQDHGIDIGRAQTLCDMLKSKTKAERQRVVGLQKNRADVIVFGAILLLEIMRAAQAPRVIVSDRDNLEGYLAMQLGLVQICPR